MEEVFTIPVEYKGKEHAVTAQLQVMGYTYRIEITVNEAILWLERDDSGSFRAVLPPGTPEKEAAAWDKDFIATIIDTIEKILA